MNELENKLKDLRKKGYEQIDILQILNWIAKIKRKNMSKRNPLLKPK